MKALMPLIVISAATQSAQAADIAAGKQLATTVCAADDMHLSVDPAGHGQIIQVLFFAELPWELAEVPRAIGSHRAIGGRIHCEIFEIFEVLISRTAMFVSGAIPRDHMTCSPSTRSTGASTGQRL